jgi:hypothetical protein
MVNNPADSGRDMVGFCERREVSLMRSRRSLAVIVVLLFHFTLATSLFGSTAKGRGAIVLHDDAPVFKKSTDKEPVIRFKRGDSVVGYKSVGMTVQVWEFDEENGLLRVAYLLSGPPKNMKKGWMRPEDLEQFTYADCGITDLQGKETYPAVPWSPTGDWTICFQEARDAKQKELQAKGVLP